MTWAKFCDGFLDHPKVLKAGEDAANLFMRGCIWCSKHLTDGAIPREALRALTIRRDAPALAARLVSANLWEPTPDGWQVHDWRDHNPTRESVEGKREKTREKVAAWREKHAKPVTPETCEHNCNRVTCEVCNRGVTPPPSRPVPSPSEGSKEPLSPVPMAPTTPPLELTPPEAPRAAKAKRPKSAKPSVLPFSVVEALDAIASTSGGRFVPGDRSTWTKGWNIALAAYVKRFPDLALWRRVGAHVAAGGGWAKQTLGPEWAASDGFVAVVNLLPDWERRGMPTVDARFVVAGHAQPVAAPTASQPHAPKKVFLGDEFRAAAKTAREDA